MPSQLRANRPAVSSQLSAATLGRVRAATGFRNIQTVGPQSIRNPLTGRISRLQNEREVTQFEERAVIMVGRARFLHSGVDGYGFRRVQVRLLQALRLYLLTRPSSARVAPSGALPSRAGSMHAPRAQFMLCVCTCTRVVREVREVR